MNLERFKQQLRQDEGVKNKIYFVNGLPHLGVGHLITKKDPEHYWLKCFNNGASEIKISTNTVEQYFNQDINIAINACKAIFKNWESLSDEVQEIIANMVFNMGGVRFKNFKKFITAIDQKNYTLAAEEMKNSLWYKQVGNRAKRLYNKMLEIAKTA